MSPTTDAIDAVLLPTDGSDGALAGAARGLDLAVAADATVHVLSVVDTSDGFSSLLGDEPAADRAAMESEAEAAVETVAAMVRERAPDLEVTTTTERGTPFRVINSYVDEAGIDAVSMGTRGRTGLERILLGSVTENVLRTVPVPVLAVPPEAAETELRPETVENVCLPTDGSDGAAAAVDWGVRLATVFDAMVHAVYSADTSRFGSAETPEETLVQLEEEGEAALEAVRERAVADGVSVTGTVASGPPVGVILDYTDRIEIDLLVIGTHGRSGLERQFLGSVTETVVRNADVPVFCVPMHGRSD